MNGFKFNGLHSYKDLGLYMEEKKIMPPSKKKTKETVPFMNGTYDFSMVGSNGEPSFTERELRIKLSIPTHNKKDLYIVYSKVLEWLMDTGKNQLIFDDIPDFYFFGDVENISNFEEILTFGKMEVTFIAEPFKRGVDFEGDLKLWDTFCFDTDILQHTFYNVGGSKTIKIINPGRTVSPIIKTTSSLTLTMEGKNFNAPIGQNKIYGFKLKPGENTIVVSGTGDIDFIFRKELL